MLDNAKKLPEEDLEQASGGVVVWTGRSSQKDQDHPTRHEVFDDKGVALPPTFDGNTLAEGRAAAQQYAESVGVDPTVISRLQLQMLRGKNKNK